MQAYLRYIVLFFIVALLESCASMLGTRYCGRADLQIGGQIVDQNSRNALAGVSIRISIVENERTVCNEFECALSDGEGYIEYEGVVRWGSYYGPIAQMRASSRHADLILKAVKPGFEPILSRVPVSSIPLSENGAYKIDLGTLELRSTSSSPVDREANGEKSGTD